MVETVVHLVRHGEVHNPKKLLYGRLPDFHLSSRGRSMAARTATSFKGKDVTYLAAPPRWVPRFLGRVPAEMPPGRSRLCL